MKSRTMSLNLQVSKFCLISFGVIMVIIFGTPVISNLIVMELIDISGCDLSPAGPSECLIWGVDFGNRLFIYESFISFIFAPLVFLIYFWDIILIWLVCYLVLHIQKWRLNYGS